MEERGGVRASPEEAIPVHVLARTANNGAASIVAVHGLNENPTTAWTAPETGTVDRAYILADSVPNVLLCS